MAYPPANTRAGVTVRCISWVRRRMQAIDAKEEFGLPPNGKGLCADQRARKEVLGRN